MDSKEDIILKNRIKELARLSYLKEIPTNTLFLNLHEQTIFHSIISELPKQKHVLFGGYEAAERKVVCFVPSYTDEISFDMLSVLKISPKNAKFSDELKHKDFLGALMNLGLERNTLGDILISENTAYIVVLEKIKNIIKDNLEFIKHTKVVLDEAKFSDLTFANEGKEALVNAASLRLDVLIAAVFNKSRTVVSELVLSGLVFINGKQSTNHSYTLKEGEIISVRGLGRFKFVESLKTTKKNRLVLKVLLYT